MKKVELKTINEIKAAVEAGKTVYVTDEYHKVIRDYEGLWWIKGMLNGYCIWLCGCKDNPDDGVPNSPGPFYYMEDTSEH